MKGIFLNTLAHPRLDCARLHPSRRRVLAAPGDGTDANQLTFPDPLGFATPFAPSSPCPNTRLRAARIGGFILPPLWGSRPSPALGHCDRLPLTGEPGRPPPAFWPANGRHVRAGSGQRTNASFPQSGQTHGFRCPFATRFSHSTPRQRSPRIHRWAFPWSSHPAKIRFVLAGSTRTAYQAETPALRLAFNGSGVSLHALAHPRLDRARLHPSRRRVLAAPVRTNANQLTFPDRLGFARPFAPSSPRPIARLRTGRIGGWTFGTVRQTHRTTRTFPDLTDQARISDVIQDSDFRTEIASQKKPRFSAVPPCVRRTTGDFATSHRFHLRLPNT
jgi:hypothetical protein